MARGIDGRRTDYGKAEVTINSDGDGSKTVSFAESFVAAPQVMAVAHAGDSGSFEALSITDTGFTVTITGSDQVSQDIEVVWFAHEKS